MSSSRRVDACAALAAAASTFAFGCMKIYPDPELPDVEVEWYDIDCRTGTGDVALALIGVDDPAERHEVTVACTALQATFEDVARERFRVDGTLKTTEGEQFTTATTEVDLRDGLDHRASLYFGGFDNFRVAWTFEMGATCASLEAAYVFLDFSSPEFPEPFPIQAPCQLNPFSGSAPGGMYTVSARAGGATTVAVATESREIVIDSETITDLGTFVLAPCAPNCP